MISLPVSSVDGIPIIVDIVPKGNTKVRPAYAMVPKDVAVHNTGNSAATADALMHGKYLRNNVAAGSSAPYASWHYTVDDKRIVQHIPLNESAWHTGDGSGATSGNRTAIGVEIAENSDGDYAKAERNAVILVAFLIKTFDMGINRVRPHQFYSGKYCPHIILSRDGNLEKFKANVVAQNKGGSVITEPAPAPQPVPSELPAPKSGEGIVDYLNRVGIDSSFANRQVLAKQYGVTGYSGTAAQNSTLLTKIYEGSKSSGNPAPKSGEGVVAYHTRLGIDSSYSNREKLAAKYGISGYRGTAAQNEQLIQAVYKGKSVSSGSGGSSSSGIKQVGTVQIVNLNSFTYVYAKPDKSSKRVGEAKKGAKFPIAGSLSGWYEVIHNGKRAYIDAKYCKKV
ncbi:N-acetylmuramoyl-L-alanine amidase [Alkalicoccobacillus gibsonii]|uniref:N-acetylmuramoyl-L-alanine amidase n=1 Tax=Alkalicoccobacillus gibsonii TaxID=79881 RepID=UPI00351915A4